MLGPTDLFHPSQAPHFKTSKDMGVQNVQHLEGSYSFIVLYFIHNYTHTYWIVEWYRQHSCVIMLRPNV